MSASGATLRKSHAYPPQGSNLASDLIPFENEAVSKVDPTTSTIALAYLIANTVPAGRLSECGPTAETHPQTNKKEEGVMSRTGRIRMLRVPTVFLVVAAVAAVCGVWRLEGSLVSVVFGFRHLGSAATWLAWVVFVVFLGLFMKSVFMKPSVASRKPSPG